MKKYDIQGNLTFFFTVGGAFQPEMYTSNKQNVNVS